VLGVSDVVADERLRQQGKKALEELVNSPNESVRLRAATALYSYRAAAPPPDPVEFKPQTAGKPVVLRDLLIVAIESNMVTAERGGAILVDGERVERTDSRTPRKKPRARPLGGPPRARATTEVSVPQASPAPSDLDRVQL
jgi:hypothetical protein